MLESKIMPRVNIVKAACVCAFENTSRARECGKT
jgi:hypothetical protein